MAHSHHVILLQPKLCVLGLTAIIIQRGKLGALVPTAGAVARLHLQLIPGGLTQLGEEDISRGVGAHALPGPGAFGAELEKDSSDGAAAARPALQVEAGVGGVDVSEQGLVLIELRLCKTRNNTND